MLAQIVYFYSRYGIGVDDSSSVYINNKKKDILFLEEGPTQGLDDTKMTEDAKYFINFPISQMTFCLDLH